MGIAHIVCLVLLEEGVVLVLITAGGGSHATASAGAEVVFVFFEVVGWVRGECCLGLGCEGRIGDRIGQGACAAEVHYVAEGHPSCYGEEDAVGRDDVSFFVSRWAGSAHNERRRIPRPREEEHTR
jgi:hypothetical protein